MQLQKLFLVMFSCYLFGGCADLRARRTLYQTTMLAQDKIVLLQNEVRTEKFFDLQTLNKIFHKDALEANISVEEKLRSFYKINPDIPISLLGELLKIACPEISYIELKNNCYFIKKIDTEKDFEFIDGIIVCKQSDFNQEYFFFKSNLIDCKIELEKSTYCSIPLLQHLSIMPSGKIANPEYEKQLLQIIYEYRNIIQGEL